MDSTYILHTYVAGISEGDRDHLRVTVTSWGTCQILWTCWEARAERDFCITTITNRVSHFHLNLKSAAINNKCYSKPI